MKANEFIKKYGLEKAQNFLELPSYTIDQLMMLRSGLRCDELERLIEAHDLVEKLGGLEKAKQSYNRTGRIIGDHKLEQAIAGVESCQ